MRKLLAIAAFAALSAPMAAQSLWTPELGFQGGYIKVKPAGTGANDAINFIEMPIGTYVQQVLMNAPLFAVIPAGKKLAIEPQFGLTQLNVAGGNMITTGRATLRADYALNPKVYVAGGLSASYLDQGPSTGHIGLGVTVAAGYRVHLTGGINARLEANWLSTKRSNGGLAPINAYQALLGVSSSLKTPARAARARSAGQAWDRVLGISGGYFGMRSSGGSFSGFAFPGLGSSLTAGGAALAPMTTLFAIIPVGGKLAVEPGFDVHSISTSGTKVTGISVSGRLDYAATGNWYGAVGGNMQSVSGGGTSGSVTGLQVAWGYRFHLAGAFGGRFEGSYLMSGKSTKLGTPPINTVGLTFGATMPLQ